MLSIKGRLQMDGIDECIRVVALLGPIKWVSNREIFLAVMCRDCEITGTPWFLIEEFYFLRSLIQGPQKQQDFSGSSKKILQVRMHAFRYCSFDAWRCYHLIKNVAGVQPLCCCMREDCRCLADCNFHKEYTFHVFFFAWRDGRASAVTSYEFLWESSGLWVRFTSSILSAVQDLSVPCFWWFSIWMKEPNVL